ncbi:hypothetical protein IE53DRAFT_408637 [Violaceomyces palustris]|uniref:Uncharacterized protein n=1 Tax=Violaceomyces palustris TaxID=1673888 RepID=A0ACD0P5Z4_9BASI|nr:hypothetical protein IE53DRAFT_408637 [Violaceomyces palustris]
MSTTHNMFPSSNPTPKSSSPRGLQVFVLLPNADHENQPVSWVETLVMTSEDVEAILRPYGLDLVAFLRYAISSLIGSLDVRVFSSQEEAENLLCEPSARLSCPAKYFVRPTPPGAELFPTYYKDLDLHRSSVKGRRKGVPTQSKILTAVRDQAICQWTGAEATQICHLIPSRRGERIAERIASDLRQSLRPHQVLRLGARVILRSFSMLDHPRNLIFLKPDIHQQWDQALLAFIPYPNVAYDEDRQPRPYHSLEEVRQMNQPSTVFALPLGGVRMTDDGRLSGPSPHPMSSDLWPQEFLWSYAFASRFGVHFATRDLKSWARNYQGYMRELDERNSDTDITETTASGMDLDNDEQSSAQSPPAPSRRSTQVPSRQACSMASLDKVSAWSRGLPTDPAEYGPASEQIE